MNLITYIRHRNENGREFGMPVKAFENFDRISSRKHCLRISVSAKESRKYFGVSILQPEHVYLFLKGYEIDDLTVKIVNVFDLMNRSGECKLMDIESCNLKKLVRIIAEVPLTYIVLYFAYRPRAHDFFVENGITYDALYVGKYVKENFIRMYMRNDELDIPETDKRQIQKYMFYCRLREESFAFEYYVKHDEVKKAFKKMLTDQSN